MVFSMTHDFEAEMFPSILDFNVWGISQDAGFVPCVQLIASRKNIICTRDRGLC